MGVLRDYFALTILITVYLRYSYGAPPSESEEMRIRVKEHENVVMPCTVPYDIEKYQVKWSSKAYIFSDDRNLYISSTRYRLGNEDTPRDFAMVIDGALQTDASDYTCTVRDYDARQETSHTYLLSIEADGSWQPWSQWGECTVTCGGGTRLRSRECNEPSHGGAPCAGPYSQTEACMEQNCPVMAEVVVQQWGPRHAIAHVTLSQAYLTSTNGTRTFELTYKSSDGRDTYKLEQAEKPNVLLMDLDPNKKYLLQVSPGTTESNVYWGSPQEVTFALTPRGSVGLPLSDALGKIVMFEPPSYHTFKPYHSVEIVNPSHYREISVTTYTGAQCPHKECGMLKFASPVSHQHDISLIFHDERVGTVIWDDKYQRIIRGLSRK